MDRKINSITIGNESCYEWEISKLMNNSRFVFIVFKDLTYADSVLHNNSKFISFGSIYKISLITCGKCKISY